jgi:type IV pilus assembly protein PilB
MFRIPDDKLRAVLVGDGLIDGKTFDENLENAKRSGMSVADMLISRSVIPAAYIENAIGSYLGIPAANLDNKQIDMEALKLLPEETARQRRVVLFGREGDGAISAAMEDPTDLSTIQFLERYLKLEVKPYIASSGDLNKGFSLYSQATAANFKYIIEENIAASIQSKITGEEAASELPIVSILDNLLAYAMSSRASDIHLEVFDEFILVRYRVDGILHEVLRIPKEVHPAIIARIKLLGGMRIDEHTRPQDGRFRYKTGMDTIDLRVSIIPTFYGEKAELRLLSTSIRPLSFSELGMLEDTAGIVGKSIEKSYGMLLVCGPTGSGKTTTLYSVLNVLNKPEVNIVTVEDPVEYDIQYINQTQINPAAGITFASGLRAILRQDPNVIMVGEIRDGETASIAVQSSLTGHLVVSSLHTNDAPTAIPRLFDMEVEPFLVSAVLNAVIAQRLVRRIHMECIESYTPEPDVVESIRGQLKQLNIPDAEVEARLPGRIYRGAGCEADGFTGYQGRLGIYEVLDVTEEIRKFVAGPNFSLGGLREISRQQGSITMFEDGLRKVERGITTIDEVLRVFQE